MFSRVPQSTEATNKSNWLRERVGYGSFQKTECRSARYTGVCAPARVSGPRCATVRRAARARTHRGVASKRRIPTHTVAPACRAHTASYAIFLCVPARRDARIIRNVDERCYFCHLYSVTIRDARSGNARTAIVFVITRAFTPFRGVLFEFPNPAFFVSGCSRSTQNGFVTRLRYDTKTG